MVRMQEVRNRGLPSGSPMTPTSGQYVEGMDSRNSLCTNLSPHKCAAPSSFFQTICTKDPDKGAQSDATVTSQNVSTRKQSLVAAKECVCALNENISLVRFFDRRKECFEGNIYNTPRQKHLMSKSCHSLKLIVQNKSTRN